MLAERTQMAGDWVKVLSEKKAYASLSSTQTMLAKCALLIHRAIMPSTLHALMRLALLSGRYLGNSFPK
jgi:hypothetical protein